MPIKKMYLPSAKTLEDTFKVIEEMKTHIEQSAGVGFSFFQSLDASATGKQNPSAWCEAYKVIRYILKEESMYDFSTAHPTAKAHLAILRKAITILKKVKPHDS